MKVVTEEAGQRVAQEQENDVTNLQQNIAVLHTHLAHVHPYTATILITTSD